ncbi:MAG: hypothetical protein KAT58_03565, partial [candidate division Zixibacteria bacterium]|nr:hypothetical protein [candidate division Zixibacteria bacterium]
MRYIRSLVILAALLAVLVPVADSMAQSDPVINPIGPSGTAYQTNLSFDVWANEPDGDSIFWTISQVSPAPVGAMVLTDDGTNPGDTSAQTATFNWTPAAADIGIFSVMFVATAGADADSELVRISVDKLGLDPVNIPPTRISAYTTDTLILEWAVSVPAGNDPDTVCKIILHSFNERTFAGKTYRLKVWDNQLGTELLLDAVSTAALPFQTNDSLIFQACHDIKEGHTDTFKVYMDAHCDTIPLHPAEYDVTGVRTKILPGRFCGGVQGGYINPDTIMNTAC